MPSKNEKKQKSLFLKKFKLQCDFHNYENYVLSQLVFFCCVFLNFHLPSTSSNVFCVFFRKFSFPLWKKTHFFHFSPDFLQSSFTLRIWNWWNCVLISFEKKTLIFETLLFQFVEQKRAWLMVFSKGDQILFLKNDFFTLEYQISQNVKKVSKTVFSARLGGVCKPQKKRKLHLPVWFWNTKIRITAVFTIWKILGHEILKNQKTTFFSQRGWRFFKNTAAFVLCVRGLTL